MAFMKKSTLFVIKNITVDNEDNNIRNTNVCDARANIYDEMVLKIFIHTIAKRHVKRLTVVTIYRFFSLSRVKYAILRRYYSDSLHRPLCGVVVKAHVCPV